VTIPFQRGECTKVEIAILDVSGRPVATLVDRELDAAAHAVVWNGETLDGGAAVSGPRTSVGARG